MKKTKKNFNTNNQNRSSKNIEADKFNANNNFNNKFSECVVPDSQNKDNIIK